MDALNTQIDTETAWINPVGGYGDMLMVCGVLKQAYDKNGSTYNLIRRTRYTQIFRQHEAICFIGHPPSDAKIQHVSYWSMASLDGKENRPYQVLARAFGLETPVEEKLYLPGIGDPDPVLTRILKQDRLNVLIAPASDSPRKMLRMEIWHELANRLIADGIFVIQAGQENEVHIRNTYSIQGLTTPQQLASFISQCDLVVTLDNFIMHLAHMQSVPCVAIWGATQSEIYGYPGQCHIQNQPCCDIPEGASCLITETNRNGEIYMTPCPLGDNRHCMNQTGADTIYHSCMEMLNDRI